MAYLLVSEKHNFLILFGGEISSSKLKLLDRLIQICFVVNTTSPLNEKKASSSTIMLLGELGYAFYLI